MLNANDCNNAIDIHIHSNEALCFNPALGPFMLNNFRTPDLWQITY
jgi:hypothetical protein